MVPSNKIVKGHRMGQLSDTTQNDFELYGLIDRTIQDVRKSFGYDRESLEVPPGAVDGVLLHCSKDFADVGLLLGASLDDFAEHVLVSQPHIEIAEFPVNGQFVSPEYRTKLAECINESLACSKPISPDLIRRAFLCFSVQPKSVSGDGVHREILIPLADEFNAELRFTPLETVDDESVFPTDSEAELVFNDSLSATALMESIQRHCPAVVSCKGEVLRKGARLTCSGPIVSVLIKGRRY